MRSSHSTRASFLLVLGGLSLVALGAGCSSSDSGDSGGPGGGEPSTDAGTDGSDQDAPAEAAAEAGPDGASEAGADAPGDATDDGATEAEAGPPHAGPPAPPAMTAPDGTGTTVLAISKLFLGDADRGGTPSGQAWKQFGFDVDGDLSTAASTGLCKPRNNASTSTVYPDGVDGTDNSFGKNLLPIFLGIDSSTASAVNDALSQGAPRLLFALDQLGVGSTYNPLVARLYGGAELGTPPKYDGTDAWPVLASSLNDVNDPTSAKVLLSGSYVSSRTWVSAPQPIALPTIDLTMHGFTLHLPITSARASMDLAADGKSATNGTISGVIATDAFVAEMRRWAGSLDPSLCSGATIDSIVAQIEQASDIMKDGTQDATQECDGISIGLGFDAQLVQLGAGQADPVLTDPCAP